MVDGSAGFGIGGGIGRRDKRRLLRARVSKFATYNVRRSPTYAAGGPPEAPAVGCSIEVWLLKFGVPCRMCI